MSYFEGRRRWRSRKAKNERTPSERGASMAAAMRGLVILMFGILIIQLINLQVIKGDQYREQAEINALREIPIPANRGLVYDRNGTLLVQNTARFSATIIPGDLTDGDEATAYRLISNVIGMPASEIEARVSPSQAPQVISMSRSSVVMVPGSRPRAPRMIAAVARVRPRGLATISKPSTAMPRKVSPTARAWASPRLVRGESSWPCMRPARFHSVSPWRMR